MVAEESATVVVLLTVLVVYIVLCIHVHDRLQGHLGHRRKLKSSGSHRGDRFLLILLFPITLYIVIGTLLFLLLYLIELASKNLRHYSGAREVEAIAWHQLGVGLTLSFPLTWPLAALLVGSVFVGSVCSAILKTVETILNAIVKLVRRIWVNIVRTLHEFLDWLTDFLRWISEMVVQSIQTIWESVIHKSQLISEQLSGLINDFWAAISNRIRL